MKRLDQLTFTRFAMILLVLIYHGTSDFYVSLFSGLPFAPLLRAAPTAVSYLYVLSGFVMALVYFRPEKPFDLFGYWRARFVRIYPLYIIAFILISIYYFDAMFSVKPQKIVANLLVIQAWIPAYSQSFNYAAWSMTVEFFFYAIFPFFVFWAAKQPTRKLIWVSLAFWAFSQLVHHSLWLEYYPERKDILAYFPLFHLNSFIIGVVGGIWYLREGRQLVLKRGVALVVAVISFLFVAIYTQLSLTSMPFLPRDLQAMAGLLAPLQILFILALALDESLLSKIFSRPALVNLGETSYAIYILHVPLVWLYERWLETSGIVTDSYSFLQATFLPAMILIGLVAHFYIDIPLRRWFKDFIESINLRLLLVDLAIAGFTAFFVFQLRFGTEGREYRSYRDMERLVFWVAFFARPTLSLLLGMYRRSVLSQLWSKWFVSVVLSVSLGSFAMAGAAYAGYLTGWFENFPRSVFILDWFIVLALSLFVRLLFRTLNIYRADALPA